MSVVEELTRLGGVATRATLTERCSRPALEAAISAGDVIRLSRGRYALPAVDQARAAAHALTGVLCLGSAALHWGWPLKQPPERPQVSVPKTRKMPPHRARTVDLRRLTLHPDDVVDGVTSPDRTLLDCLRHLPFDEALTVADSALRDGFPGSRLQAVVRDARGPRAARTRQIAALATPDAANPFESVLRALALGVSDLHVRPQVSLRAPGGVFLGRPDLVDERLAIVLEADSFAWHGDRAALHSDARRYNSLVVNGWLVLRFSWEEVMFHSDAVKSVLRAAVAERTEHRCIACRTAP